KERKLKGTFAFKTDIGKTRTDNEDQAIVVLNTSDEVFMAVCDGMGGASKGDLASKIAIESLRDSFKAKKKNKWSYLDKLWITKAARIANHAIYSYAESHPSCQGMGTTMVVALLSDERLLIANIGDSRLYTITEEAISQLTTDQTYVKYLVDTKQISTEQAKTHPERHVLMNALGIYPSVSLDIDIIEYHGESILLCSDGLYNQVSEQEIKSICLTDERVDQKVKSLIIEANNNGGSDNVGIAYWESIHHD
nr:Stp1/IreP family PP2C-type Ser/Thr phosphatase [Bacilli bacterium]